MRALGLRLIIEIIKGTCHAFAFWANTLAEMQVAFVGISPKQSIQFKISVYLFADDLGLLHYFFHTLINAITFGKYYI